MHMRRSLTCLALLLLAALVVTSVPASAQGTPKYSYWPSGTGAWPGSGIGLRFGEAMDSASVESAFSVQPAVAGAFVWSDGNAQFEFRPAEPLAAQQRYAVSIDTTARTAAGRPVFDRAFGWSFDTAADTAQMRFSYGMPVQLVPPAGKPGISIMPGYPRMTIDFVLYAFDEAHFAAAYPELSDGDDDLSIDTAGLAEVAKWSTHVDASDTSIAEVKPPDGLAPALYVVDARAERAGSAQAVIILTDYTLVAKDGRSGRTFWVNRLPDGQAAASAVVTLYRRDGTVIGAATTDVDGIATLAGTPDSLFATARADGQTTLVGLDYYWSSGGYYWRWWGGWTATPPQYSGHVHTDRPIYRPGHTVHYKATLRNIELDGYSVVAPSVPVTVTVTDNAGNTVETTTRNVDEFGSIAGDFTLGADIGLGQWQIAAAIGRQTFTAPFQVQEYVKPDYEVVVTPDQPYYVRGDTATIEVAARYYFGQPVAAGEVTLRVFRGSYWWYSRSGNQVGQYDGVLDANGKWSARLALEGNSDYSETYYFEAEVIDANRRPVVEESSVPVHPAAFTLELRSERYGVEVGQPVIFTATTRDHDGQPVANRLVSLDITGYFREGERIVRHETATTGPDGTVTIELDAMNEGWYSIRGSALDDAGRAAIAYSYAWLYSVRYPWFWWGGLEITADKDSYQVGDTAVLLIKSPVNGKALVTLEREDVHEAMVVDIDGATTVEVPIRAAYSPNVWASVQMWDARTESRGNADAGLISATTSLSVPADNERLRVTITPDAAQHQPREQATFTVGVRDADGTPVEAQLSFALVDKAVLALAADQSGDIFDAFWQDRPDSVAMYDTLTVEESYYRGLPELGPGRGNEPPQPGDKSGEGTQDSQEAPRREFPDTAIWQADLVTDANGEATVTLTLPDSLTTWVAMARAITKSTKAGQGSAELLVTKSIIADPALPRFAVQGDQFALDVLSRNYTEATVQATCALDAPGLIQLDPGTRDLELPVGQTQVARWTVVASELGSGLVTSRLTTPAGNDAIELPLPVEAFAVPDRFVVAGYTDASVDESFEVPFNAIPESSTVEIRLAPSIALGILDGLEELIGYPYGCIEQTMSRMMPNAAVGRLLTQLDIQAPEITDKLPDMTAVGLQKVYGYQNADGSWGWWRGDGNIYITSYVLHGLLLTEQAGYEVDPDVIEKGFTWLVGALASETDERIRAYGAYVMAIGGRGDTAMTLAVYQARDRLDAFSLAALAVALSKVGRDDLAQSALDALIASAAETPTTVSWPVDVVDWRRWDDYHWRTMASTEKNTAMALEALAVLRPDSPLAPKAARWLMENRWGWSGGWSTTQATTFSILALTDYIVSSGELWAEYDWSVALDGNSIAAGRIDASNVKERLAPVVLTGDDLTPGAHQLTIAKVGRGTLYYTVVGRMALYYDGFEPTAAEGFGMTLSREYSPVAGRGDLGGWHAGDVVNVRLTVETTEDLHYMIIEDMLPAGFEALNEQLATESTRVPTKPEYRWYWWGYERKEVHDQKVTFFASYLSRGVHTFDYAARVVTPGLFSARPAESYAMYRPEVWARSASAQVSIDADRIAQRPPLSGDFDRDCRLTSFDASLVAEAWPADSRRDVNGDGRLDVADIALAGGHSGLVCGNAVPLPPGDAGEMALRLVAPEGISVGQTFDLELRASGNGNVGGFEATLAWPAGAFEVVGVHVDDLVAGAMALEQDESAGIRFGGFAPSGIELSGEKVLARVTLRAASEGEATIAVVRAQMVTDEGGEYRVVSDGTVVSPAPWRPMATLYMPSVAKLGNMQ